METTVVMAFLSRSPPSVVGSHSQFSLKEHFMARRSFDVERRRREERIDWTRVVVFKEDFLD